MKKTVKTSMVLLALGLGLSIGTTDEVEAISESPYAFFNELSIRETVGTELDQVYKNKYKEKIDKLDNDFENNLISNEEYEKLFDKLTEEFEANLLEKQSLFNDYQLFKKEELKDITSFGGEFELNSSLSGFNQFSSLKIIQGEGGNFNSFRELNGLKELREVWLEGSNQLTLNSFKNSPNLETIILKFNGFENYDERLRNEGFSQTLTTDISALSNLNKLKQIRINACGRMATITLKKGTTSYRLFDPIVASKQFEGAEMNYSSSIESDEWLEWNNLEGNEEYLDFSWRVEKGSNFSYTGEGQIPIRWK
ncbi:hypothetical protein IGJ02_002243 [Enterococcus sp. DIV0724b]|uniref:hypothetical protein n=1 Tax=Enterococcus sp. DIV0724b TaxID=2774694 RepID=UPI003D2FB281